jgi:YD repeat-containing protein
LEVLVLKNTLYFIFFFIKKACFRVSSGHQIPKIFWSHGTEHVDMKNLRFFLLLFLIPSFIYASHLHQDECKKLCDKALAEWNQSSELIEQLNRMDPNQAGPRTPIFERAIAHCQQAIGYWDKILNDIAKYYRRHSKKRSWQPAMKERCEQDKEACVTRLGMLQNTLTEALSFEKAKVLYAESLKKADLAQAKIKNCPRHLNNIDTVVAALNEIARLYEEAASTTHEALILITPFPREADKALLNQTLESFQEAAHAYKQEAADWPSNVLAQQSSLKERLILLEEEIQRCREGGLKRGSLKAEKQMVPILEQLIENGEEGVLEKFVQTKQAIELFDEAADAHRLTEEIPTLSSEKLKEREQEHRTLFFRGDLDTHFFIQRSFLQNKPYLCAIPLDGQISTKGEDFVLYTEQFYRFLVQSETPLSHLLVKVYDRDEIIHEETITLPIKNTLSWERHLTTDGMVFIPETKLKAALGLDLRLTFACDPGHPFSLIIAQKSSCSGHSFSISLDEEVTLYRCAFSAPPPWQLGMLRKPAPSNTERPIGNSPLSKTTREGEREPFLPEALRFPILDQLVEELNGNPLALARYVYNEITLIDPFLHQENGVFQAPGIHRNPYMTFLEKQGSPWEQCQLLVYLLRKAGYKALYAIGEPCSLPKAFVEKMLLTQLPEEQQEGLLKYPWVLLFDGKESIALFPWMKEIDIHEGYDLYNLMPEEYASADRWILRYLKGDEKILKYIDSDGDDTAGVLFVRFVEEELRKQKLSLADVGIHRTQLKKQIATWEDFPRTSTHGDYQILDSLDSESRLSAYAKIEIFSHENPLNRRPLYLPLTVLSCFALPMHFSAHEGIHHLYLGDEGVDILTLDPTDHHIDVKVTYSVPIGTYDFEQSQTFTFAKGSNAALCFHFGGASSKVTTQFYERFTQEKEEEKRLPALLAFVGAAYFEKCGRAEQILATLHKVIPRTLCTFGLAKLSPDLTKGSLDPTLPQVDMVRICSRPPTTSHQEIHAAHRQWQSLTTVDFSSNEHQILHEIFEDPHAISTVKLLQLAHLQQQKKGLPEEGFLLLTPSTFEAAENRPEAAHALYFSHLKDLNLRDVKRASPGEWNTIKNLLESTETNNDWAYAYLTPGPIASQNGAYREMGALILNPYTQYALISNNNLLFHGGLGSLPSSYFIPLAIEQWQPTPYTLQTSPPRAQPPSGNTKWSPDVRPEHKSLFDTVVDPVDIITGAFYIDAVDLVLPGSFPLEIRRNYNSQNPLHGAFGCGWKLSLNPFLIEQEGKLYAAEADGTVITYSFNQERSRWEVLPEENPDLCNFNQKGIGSIANPFHAYIENNILYGSDGSKRIFEEGLLRKWINASGTTLTFSYKQGHLSRIESSNGDFCGMHYNHTGKISEIYAQDGRILSYTYNAGGDLIRVELPNTAIISYEYDRFHRIIRETRPHGNFLENIYDEQGRVIKQRSPVGPQQALITSATFSYKEGITTVTDGEGGETTYQIFQKQIYKITDPLGYQIMQAWFIDEKSWFDPERERIVDWNQPGGYPRSLKASIDRRGLVTNYLYDRRGNPEEIGLVGNDLTGSGEKRVVKKLTSNAQNLPIEEATLDHKTITTYDSIFPYLPKRVEKICGTTLLSYIDLEYNSLGQIQREDHSGAITLWKYDSRGFPIQKIQLTGTDDPDLITEFSYNDQGQCIHTITAESIQKSDYDIMGNRFRSQLFSPSGTLLSATYIGYNLNNQPIWKQTANPQNTLYLDYHASGPLKATRQHLSPTHHIAYTLYEQDSQGHFIEEVDPLGHCTERIYDALGRLEQETKGGLSTLFSYEPGGLIETITSPSGATTTRLYTTNGLLKEEIYPDGTKSICMYDFFGRPILETKKGITWEMSYDDAERRVIRTHLESATTEIQEFDARGNLIRFTDAAGHTLAKTYDGLNRIKTATTPSGEQTTWSYQGNTTIHTLPNGEQTTERYEGGHPAESKVFDATGALIAHSTLHYDPETDQQKSVQGDEVTTTWMNALGLPIRVQKGGTTTTYEYNARGDCIASIDGEGRRTHQTFDPIGRIIEKELPDGTLIRYDYDLDSHLIACHLPNNVTWKAFYDCMGRKCVEELQSGEDSSQRWEYTYENGYLKEAKDPLQRIHNYLYDTQERLIQESVNGWQRVYTYDPRGLLSSAEQTGAEHSRIERSYDSDGRLILESLFLNSDLIQQTCQQWTPSSRSLQIGNHQRDFVYQNNQLVQISTGHHDLSYAYHLSGALKNKTNPLSTTTLDYSASGLPQTIYTHLLDGDYKESLEWDPSGRLSTYSAPEQQKQFSYTPRGYLHSAGAENYAFDFGTAGTGVRIAAPNRYVPQNGIDDFGKIVAEVSDGEPIATVYNPMGEVISHHQKRFEWDPWGRLLQVTDGTFTWEASYDALGRRLQTRYISDGRSWMTTTSFYDPEEEFQEMGVKYGDQTFWKIYGPDACDALIDERGAAVFLLHNALGHLMGVMTQQGVHR